MTLSREDILEADDLERREVEVEEWGGSLWIRELRGDEFQQFIDRMVDEDDNVVADHPQAEWIVRCACDEDGNRLFEDDDVEKVAGKALSVQNRLTEVACDINGVELEQGEMTGN